MNEANQRLLSAHALLEELFDESSRPSLRWLRDQQKSRAIPFVKIGRLVFFNPTQVLAALEKKNTVHSR